MLLKRKRTLEEEKRIFNSQWELDYFMIETPAHTNHVVKNVKGDKANQDFCCYTSHAYAKLKGEPRKICTENLKKSVQQQTSCISTFTKSDNNRCKASYRVAYHLGIVGKPYSNGELVKHVSLTWLSAFILVRKLTIHQLLSHFIRFNAVKMILPTADPFSADKG